MLTLAQLQLFMLLIISKCYSFEGMKARFGMTWHMVKVYLLLNRALSGMFVLHESGFGHDLFVFG